MQWYNKPIKWLVDEDKLCFSVNSNTDYWQITHYGFIKDNGPFYYKEVSDDFEATVKVTGNYQELYHQAGLMIRLDEKKWIKAGIEYVDGLYSLSAVVTHNFSDWSIVANNNIQPSIWFKLLRKADYVEISYSFDGLIYQMLRLAYFPPARKVQIGMFAAAPGKESFTVTFEDFKIQSI